MICGDLRQISLEGDLYFAKSGRPSTGKRVAAVFKDQTYSMMNMQKVDVVAADGSKAIAMFKLPGGAVIAQGSQQPDREKAGPGMGRGAKKNELTERNKAAKMPEKVKSR